MWELERSWDYFWKNDFCWTIPIPLHTLDFLIICPSKDEPVVCVGLVGAWLSVLFCKDVKANTTRLFFFCCWLIQWSLVSKKYIYICMLNIIWMKEICIVEYCTENCCVIRLYLFLKFWTHFEFEFVLNNMFLVLLFGHVNMKTSK